MLVKQVYFESQFNAIYFLFTGFAMMSMEEEANDKRKGKEKPRKFWTCDMFVS